MITQAHQAHPELCLQRLCELFGISRSWYYEHLKQPEDDTEEIALRDRIEQIILEFAGYGYRRVTHALAREGWQVNHKRVLRIMQEESTAVPFEKTLRDCHYQFTPSLSGLSQCAGRGRLGKA